MPHFSIRTLMAIIVVSAIGMVALRNANELWAGLMLILVLVAMGIAALGALNLLGRERAWWQGFAVFTGGYLTAIFSPIQSNLATTQMLITMHPMVTSPGTGPPVYPIYWRQRARALATIESLKAAGRGPADRELIGTMNVLANLNTQLAGTPNQDEFLRVGHSFFALLAGLLGGTVAVLFYGRRGRQEPNP